MDLLSPWPLVVGITATVLLVVALVWWRSRPRAAGGRGRRLGAALVHALGIVLAQALAIACVGLAVNRQYEFYTSWAEVLGKQDRTGNFTDRPLKGQHSVPITKVRIHKANPHPHGMMTSITIPGATGPYAKVPVYLPAAYFEKGQEQSRFPVLVMVGGVRMPGTKFAAMLDPIALNSRAIEHHKASPFIALYVSGSIAPGIDSECVDVPGAPHETYLTREVPAAATSQLRGSVDSRRWFIAGWSTGGLCAALMTAKHPNVYRAGAALAPYYHPIFDPQTQRAVPHLSQQNNVVEMVKKGALSQLRLLSIVSQRDGQAWGPQDQTTPVQGVLPPDARSFHTVSTRLPGAAMVVLKNGGHNTSTYFPHFPRALVWLGDQGL